MEEMVSHEHEDTKKQVNLLVDKIEMDETVQKSKENMVHRRNSLFVKGPSRTVSFESNSVDDFVNQLQGDMIE